MKKRILLLLLTIAMVMGMASCNGDLNPDNGTTEAVGASTEGTVSTDQKGPETEPVTLKLTEGGKALYTIVYPASASANIVSTIKNLKAKFKELGSVTVYMETDALLAGKTADPNAKEILIGHTNRQESETVLATVEGINDYAVEVSGNKLVINGRSENAIVNGIYYLINKVLVKEGSGVADLSFSSAQNYYYGAIYSVKNFTVLGNSPKGYTIVLSKNASFAETRFARRLQYLISSRTGYEPAIVNDETAGTEYEILIGKTARTTGTVANYEYAVLAKNNRVEMLADSAYGYEYLYSYCNTQFCSLMKASRPNAGELVRTSTVSSAAADEIASLTTRNGDVRIMQFNVWGWNESSTNPTDQRNRMTAEMIEALAPDVVCLQEYTAQMRNASKNPVPEALASKGYAEVPVDKVENIVTATPILYKTASLELLEQGVFKFTVGGGSDKFVTWAVFKTKEGNKTFGVCSVHLAYETTAAGNTYRLAQIPDVMTIAKGIETKYQCGVIITGDMNCTCTSEPYELFLQRGCTNVRDVATVTDDATTAFGDAPSYNSSADILERGKRAKGSYTTAIDHMFYIGYGLQFNSYDVLTDCYSLTMSDHAPSVADFNIGAYVKPAVDDYVGEWTKNY